MDRKSFAPWVASVGLFGACASEVTLSENPTFEEFEAATYREPWEGGLYIVDGDTPIVDEKALRELYDARYGQGLIVHRAGGVDARWSDTAKRAITYCVSNTFGTRKAQVVAAMAAATDDGWEGFADVDFIHATAHDASCTPSNTNVVFDVRPVSGQPYLARAFFPDQPRSARSLFIDSSAFGATWALENILAHETGHAIGFRHEHTRPEAATCFEDNNWRPLTPYDAASVMHYPHCNGTSDDLSFTARDAEGAAALYGEPGGPGPDPEPTPQQHHQAGHVALGTWVFLPAFNVKPGSTFRARMTGSGDPDLYVRFGARPTQSAFHCRPFLDGPNEQCELTVPASGGPAFVGIRGFTAADFAVDVTWIPPENGGGDPFLTNGVPVTVSGAAGSNKFWRVSVPAGRTLTIRLSGGSGDADLYTQFGTRPTTTTFRCRPFRSDNNETCTHTTTTAGDWYIMVRGFAAYSGASLRASF